MTKSLIAVFAFLVTVHLGCCQIVGLGDCPKLEAQKAFDINKFSGKWYEVKKYYYYYSIAGKCNTEEYSVNDDGKITVDRKQYALFINESVVGPLTTDITKPGVFNGYFPTLNYDYKNMGDYKILATDYTTFAVVYVCETFPGKYVHSNYVWILSRTRVPLAASVEAAKAVLTKNSLSLIYLLDTDNKDCPVE